MNQEMRYNIVQTWDVKVVDTCLLVFGLLSASISSCVHKGHIVAVSFSSNICFFFI